MPQEARSYEGMIWQQRSNGNRFKSRWGPAIEAAWPCTDPGQNISGLFQYLSSRIASLWRLFPYLAIPPRYSSIMLLTSVFQEMVLQIILPVSTTQSPISGTLSASVFSNLLQNCTPDLMTWREQTCVCTLYQRKVKYTAT